MIFHVRSVALTVSMLFALSCVFEPYEPDEASAGSQSVPEPSLGAKGGATPSYRWTSFALVERNEPDGVADWGAWWLNEVRPSVILDRSSAHRGIFMSFYEATRGPDPQMHMRALSIDYRVPENNLVASTRFELIGAEGRVYASGGDAIVCDGQLHVTPVIDAPSVLVALRYSCIPVVDHDEADEAEKYCAVCRLLETPAVWCDSWTIGPSL